MPNEVVCIRRRIARGDVLLSTPIIRAVKERLHPTGKIYFETDYPEIVERNPCIHYAGPNPIRVQPFVYNLGIHFESLPGWHIIDALAIGAGFKPGEIPHKLEMYPDRISEAWADMQHRALGGRFFVVLSPGPGLWAGRNWPMDRWAIIGEKLLARGYGVAVVGMGESKHPIPCTIDYRGRTCYHKLASLIRRAALFIGIDGFPIHVAGAMNTPRLGLFGVTRPDCILCDSPNTMSLTSSPDHPMTGARHRVRTMRVVEQQILPLGNPMTQITVGQVMHKITEYFESILPKCPPSPIPPIAVAS